ncbi:phospholipase D/nuclease, partial [Aureobasidium melanogenum]
ESEDDEKEHYSSRKKKFEARRAAAGLRNDQVISEDSVAKSAMLGEKKVSEEKWDENDLEQEKANWVQEELYVHGKVCIVDDRIVICGSSNINDRSQLGYHDSELTIIMEDTEVLPSVMDGHEYQAGHHAATLRRMLWREHLGLLPAQPLDADEDPNAQPPDVCPNNWHKGDEWDKLVADPLCDDVWNMWTQQATTNTEVFRHLFHADPDDNIRTFEDYQNFLPRNDMKQGHLYNKYMPDDEVKRALDKIRGHLVWMPLHFLENAEMAEKGLAVNYYTESIYT